MQKFVWFGGGGVLWVTQGRQQHNHLTLLELYVSVLHCFQVIVSY